MTIALQGLYERVIPVYLVCDESEFMTVTATEVNAAIREVHCAVGLDPVASRAVMLSVISFADTAQVLVPLDYARNMSEIRGCRTGGGARYSAVFTLLKEVIESDIDRLRSAGASVLRPIVAVVSVGTPSDPESWGSAHAQLTGPSNGRRPHIFTFGVPEAIREVLTAVATPIDSLDGERLMTTADDIGALGGMIAELLLRTARESVVLST